MVEETKLDARSKGLRKKSLRIFELGKRGHIASSFSIFEILRVLYDDILKYNPQDPRWKLRDRFILSKGHAGPALYVMLAEKGFIAEEELWKFCTTEGILGGHPSHKVPGVEASTGSLAHGLSIGVGFAISAKLDDLGFRTFVLLGDGECNEGSIWEAALCASKHKLDNLIVIIDYNKFQSYGPVREVQNLEPFKEKWESFGFKVKEVDGHNLAELKEAFSAVPFEKNMPSVIICNTIKGKGIKFIESKAEWHHKSNLKEEEMKKLYAGLEE